MTIKVTLTNSSGSTRSVEYALVHHGNAQDLFERLKRLAWESYAEDCRMNEKVEAPRRG